VLRVWEPPPDLTVSQWADRFRRLSSESSAEPGQWRTERAPYQRGIMDAVSDPSVETVVIMSSAQVGKTEVLQNVVGYHVHQDPAPILVVMPTLEMAEAYSKDRLAPMVRDTASLSKLIADPRSRDSGNTLLHKRFPGGHITLAGSNSPASLASRPVRLVLCDEVDRYPFSAGAEGDPVNLARKRATTFWNRKFLLTSTPTIRGASRIEAAYLASDQRRYHVPCPHCGAMQPLEWSRIRWPEQDPARAHAVCAECGAEIDHGDKARMLAGGQWVAQAPFNGAAGFHLCELYSPWRSWGQVAMDFLEAKRLPETLKTWVNTSLGETWEEEGETVGDADLLARREGYTLEDPPQEVRLVVAGVDVQADRLEMTLLGAAGEELWVLGHLVLWGSPTEALVWRDLDAALQGRYGVHAIACAAIDSGGHHTSQVYAFARQRASRRVYAVKGLPGAGRPIVSKGNKVGREQVRLFTVGVDTVKPLLMGRLKVHEPGPGYIHFAGDLDAEWFAQLTAEKAVRRVVKGQMRIEWVKQRPRNEALDCMVYALAALHVVAPRGVPSAVTQAPKTIADPARSDAQQADRFVHKPKGGWIKRR
jgi:phage terminase large subunit GpA-like protein